MSLLVILAFILGYFLTGYFASFLIFRKGQVDWLERMVFSVAFSIAFVGALMHLTGITTGFSAPMLLGITGAFSVVAFAVKRKEILSTPIFPKIPKFVGYEKLILALVIFQIFFAFYYTVFFPTEGSDPVVYHLSYSKMFAESGNIYDAEGFLTCCNSYPHGAHLFSTWFFLADGQINELWARLIAPITGVLFGFVAYLFGRSFFNRRVAFFSLLIVFSTPLMLAHLESTYINLPEAFFVATALYFFYKGMKNNDSRFFFASGLIGGFAPLIKPSGLIFFMAAFVLFILFRKKIDFWKNVSIFAIGALLFCFPVWYIRNYLQYGTFVYNPYPVHSVTPVWYLLPFFFVDPEININWGIGAFFLVFGLVGLYFVDKKKFENRFLIYLLLLLAVFITIFTEQGRFMLLSLIPASLLAAFGIDELLKNTGLWKKAVLLLVFLTVIPGLVFGLYGFKTMRVAGGGAGEVFLKLYIPPMPEKQFLIENQGDMFDGFDYLNKNTPANSKLLATEPKIYYIDRPVYLSENVKITDSLEESVANLKAAGITHVLVINLERKGYAIPDNVIFNNLNDTRYFENVFEKGLDIIYKVK